METTVSGDDEEVPVLGEDDSAKVHGPLEEPVVVPVVSAILLGREHVDLPLTQADGDRHRHMVVQIRARDSRRPVALEFRSNRRGPLPGSKPVHGPQLLTDLLPNNYTRWVSS